MCARYTFIFCFIYLEIITKFIVGGHHIKVIPSNGFIFNDELINEDNLHNYLDEHEIILLFGEVEDKDINLTVRVSTTTTTQSSIPPSTSAKSTIKLQPRKYSKIVNVENSHRSRRSTSKNVNTIMNNENKVLSFYLDNQLNKQITLKRTKNLIDDSFVFIRRFNDRTEFLENSTNVKNEFNDCFYRSNNSAFDLCDGKMKGIIRENSKNFIIHPLPKRFGKNYHIIYEARSMPTHGEIMNENIKFEPEDIQNRSTNYFSSTQQTRTKRHIVISASTDNDIVKELHIETAIFIDRDLYRHMEKNYPKNTESNLIRFVLAMINAVQLLYHHPSLGHKINFVLKRLEILYSDPKDLHRSSDIDIFLNSFCSWQKNLNPPNDENTVHYDHAVILTGLDLYVVSKNGKISSQVVGLAPVAGMCTATSSCTINEGKHFESVYVVAHEIGHNLGMRHDTSDSNCDPSLYIMSPTLGSGKITWSKCSRDYLNKFLKSSQSKCLLDRGHFSASLDHSAEGIFPGERFDADQQCMLKYGKDSTRSPTQHLNDICRDLHCQRDRYTWTSHPALEGTSCGEMMWCKSGVCIIRATFLESYSIPKRVSISSLKSSDRSNLIENHMIGNLKEESKVSFWSDWTAPTECESGCLYGDSGRLKEGSTGLKIFSRSCIDYRNRKLCYGKDRKYEACIAKPCYSIPRTTLSEFINQICQRAKEFDKELNGNGLQKVGKLPEESCQVFCETKKGETKSRNWMFPDGTTCRNQNSDLDDNFYCISGKCEKFSCSNSTSNFFRLDPAFCPQNYMIESIQSKQNKTQVNQENGRDYKSIDISIKFHNKTKNEAIDVDSQTRRHDVINPSFSKSEAYHSWRMNEYPKVNKSKGINNHEHKIQEYINEWIPKSGCHFSCIEDAKGIQIINSRFDMTTNIQLCQPNIMTCNKFQSTFEFATNICQKYKLKVSGLSGNGMQISPSVTEPDRSCRVACQDYYIYHRFYLVNGEQGHFPFGTKCSKTYNRYCVNGKCLEFSNDNLPVKESHLSLASFRSKRNVRNAEGLRLRTRRNFLYYTPINITEVVEQKLIDELVANINLSYQTDQHHPMDDGIDLRNPIYLSTEDFPDN